MEKNIVRVLFTGFSHDASGFSKANCTCTLIRTRSGRNIIVDTMTAWDGSRIKEALLTSEGIDTADISAVVCTHGHSDHIGCNYLFPNAERHVVGNCISNSENYYDWPTNDDETESFAPLSLDEDVTVERTPGHTLTCVSVLVRHSDLGDMVGICGDLFERAEDVDDATLWLNAGSENPQLQRQHRARLAAMCDFIIPGHGPGFSMTLEMRESLRKQAL